MRSAPVLRRLGAVALAAIVAVSLAACGGIPMSSGVNNGGPIGDEVDLPFDLVPQGPAVDATPEQILNGFILAATNPQGDFDIAKQFLASSIAEDWDPNATVYLRSDSGRLEASGDDTIEYSFLSEASINAEGIYTEAAPASIRLDYGFTRQGGQWRISTAPPGIVLPAGSLDGVFQARSLYFFDPTYRFLVPDVRWFANRPNISQRIVTSLLAGPRASLGQGVLFSEFPSGTALSTGLVSIESGTATVDLNDAVRATREVERERMRLQLVASLRDVGDVAITVDGSPLAMPAPTTVLVNPGVSASLLIGVDDEFGYITNDEITGIARISGKVVEAGATDVTLARGGEAAAVLGTGGGVFSVTVGEDTPVLVDSRSGLVAPAMDASGYIWSVPRSNPERLRAHAEDGSGYDLVTPFTRDQRIISMEISLDGTRMLFYLTSASGPRLVVYGIKRQETVPISLGDAIYDFPVGQGAPVDATWVDDHTIASLSRDGTETRVMAWTLGGPSVDLGSLSDGVSIVGGNAGNSGTESLRVLSAEGEVFLPRGSIWQRTDVVASFIANQR